MRVDRLRLRDFRTYATAEVALGPGLTVVHGPNGAGKTNLLEALYFGCTARSCRTANERDLVRFDATAARVEVDTSDRDGAAHAQVGFQPGEPKRIKVDGAPVERLTDSPARPLVSVFLPDRLELVKGAPSLRRAHLDQLVAALWPARAGNAAAVLAGDGAAQRAAGPHARRGGRRGCARRLGRGAAALGHRAAWPTAPRPWRALARRLRRSWPASSGWPGAAELRYRPRSKARRRRPSWPPSCWSGAPPTSSAASPSTGRTATSCCCCATGGALRAVGSQGQQRLGAAGAAVRRARRAAPRSAGLRR